MPQYTQPWQALLQPAQQPNPPTADYMSSMGLTPNADDDPGTAFTKSLQAQLGANSEDGRALTDSLAKARMAEQLAEQLQQRKLQLEQQYPTLHSTITTPMGTVMGAMTNGDSKVLYQATPDEKAANMAKIAAETAENTQKAKVANDPSVTQALIAAPGLKNQAEQAIADYHEAMPGIEQARTNEMNARSKVDQARTDLLTKQFEQGKQQTPKQQYEQDFTDTFQVLPDSDAGKMIQLQLNQDTPQGKAYLDRFNKIRAQRAAGKAGKTPVVPTDKVQDFSGILNQGFQPTDNSNLGQ